MRTRVKNYLTRHDLSIEFEKKKSSEMIKTRALNKKTGKSEAVRIIRKDKFFKEAEINEICLIHAIDHDNRDFFTRY